MNRTRARGTRRAVAALATAAVAVVAHSAPASADCVSAEVYYARPGGTSQYVVGPKRCVVSTPFPASITRSQELGEPSVIVVGAKVWLVAP